jgi:aryl-alcohol dehydrogenase-like predicted oxidoreductase
VLVPPYVSRPPSGFLDLQESAMHFRPLGRTGLSVSEIGFGAWGIGGDAGGAIAYGPAERDVSIDALHAALDHGITFYDTSDFYGYGRSETLIGEAFADRRSKVVIASKAGMLRDGTLDFSARHIRDSASASLERLRTDYLDLYQLHSAPLDAISDETIRTLEDLKREGVVRAFGLSARSPHEAKLAIERFGFESVQVNFNLLDRRAIECGLFELAERMHVALIVRTPLCFGFLTGRYSAHDAFHENDHRGGWDRAQLERWASANALFSALIDSVPGQTPAQFALRYCLSHACVSTVIPGMLNDAQVRENAAASAMQPLDAQMRARVDETYRSHDFFVRPRSA